MSDSKEDDSFDQKEVSLLTQDNKSIEAKLLIYEESPENPELVQIGIISEFFSGEKTGEDFFSVLCEIRKELENQGLRIKCYGASRNVYPSGMSRSMGYGEKAYKLTIGKQAKMQDLVSIFDDGQDVIPVNINEQESFFDQWAKSL
ncbi:MAG: hypothetical protein AAGA18_16130 [Verrucomicrobiota bacterium]